MKIRLDFVTNSSSSSFICIAQPVEFNDIITHKAVSPTGGKFVFLGNWLSEGRDHIELDLPMAEKLNFLIESGKVGEWFDYELLHVVDEAWDDNSMAINNESFTKALPSLGQLRIHHCDVDYHGCKNIDDIVRYYDKDY